MTVMMYFINNKNETEGSLTNVSESFFQRQNFFLLYLTFQDKPDNKIHCILTEVIKSLLEIDRTNTKKRESSNSVMCGKTFQAVVGWDSWEVVVTVTEGFTDDLLTINFWTMLRA